MKLLCRILLILYFLLSAGKSMAQNPLKGSNLRIKKISAQADSVQLDSLSMVPQSFFINDVDTSAYTLDFIRARLFWKTKPPVDSVLVSYRVFPYRLDVSMQRYRYDSIVNFVYHRPFEFGSGAEGTGGGLLDFGNIEATGSLGRELSFGNNQDAVVNSNFQLQINGMLKDSIEISAAFTDNNLPIQPDGTTQQLNEFDQVFLQFKKRTGSLILEIWISGRAACIS